MFFGTDYTTGVQNSYLNHDTVRCFFRILALWGAFALYTLPAHAQQTYLRGGLDWGFPFLTQTVTGDGRLYAGRIATTLQPAGGRSTDYHLQRASFGAGAGVTLAGGLFFTPQLGLELSARIGFDGPSFSYEASEADLYGGTTTRTVKTWAANPVVVVPAIVYRTTLKRFSSYARLGPALPLHTARVMALREEYRSPLAFQNYTITAQALEQSRFSVGVSSALGVSVPLRQRAVFFAECNATALQVYTRKRTYTAYFLNEEDVIDVIPEALRTTWYEMNYTDAGPSALGTTIRPSYAVPFSALSVVAGLSVGW